MFKPPCLLGLQVAPTSVLSTGQPDLLHHAYPGWLPAPGCGIATCLNRAIDMTGLSPAGSRPCRLLLTPATPEAHLSVPAVFVRTDAPAFPSGQKSQQLRLEFSRLHLGSLALQPAGLLGPLPGPLSENLVFQVTPHTSLQLHGRTAEFP